MSEHDWRDQAACKGYPTSIFFPTAGESAVEAKKICDKCPVAAECNTASMQGSYGDIEHGVWAGQGYRPRRTERIRTEGYRRQGRRPEPIKHGEPGGYQAHLRQGVPLCDGCRDAYNQYRRERKAALRVAS